MKTIETKVWAAVAGGAGGGAVAGFLLWLLGVLFWGASDKAGDAAAAAASVPTPVSGLVLVLLAALGAGVSGYAAPHTDRTDTAAASDDSTEQGDSGSTDADEAATTATAAVGTLDPATDLNAGYDAAPDDTPEAEAQPAAIGLAPADPDLPLTSGHKNNADQTAAEPTDAPAARGAVFTSTPEA